MRGHIRKRAGRGGKVTFQARIVGPDGREVSKTTTKKADAERWLTAQSASLDRGQWHDERAGRVLLGVFVETAWWPATAGRKPKTRASYRSLLARHVLPRWGGTPLGRVSYTGVSGWLAAMAGEGCSASTRRQAYFVLTSILDAAVKDGRIPRNVARDVDLPRLPQPDDERRTLTRAQTAALADECGDYKTLVLFLGWCGLRWGEAAALRVRRVDLLHGWAGVAESLSEVDPELRSGRAHFVAPKSHQSRRVPLPPFLRPLLAEAIEGKGPDALVFTSPHGAPLQLANFRARVLTPAAKRAGLPGVTPHMLRHSAGSNALEEGWSLKEVQRLLGHASALTTERVYLHARPERMAEHFGHWTEAEAGKITDNSRPRVLPRAAGEGAGRAEKGL